MGSDQTTYTAVLVSDTAVPVWHEPHRQVPWLFAGGAGASACAACLLLVPSATPSPPGGSPSPAGVSEVILSELMEHQLGELAVPTTSVRRLLRRHGAVFGLGYPFSD